ncbi:MAG: methyltransferase domain-containing protein, partial [Magnetospirillum sp.]
MSIGEGGMGENGHSRHGDAVDALLEAATECRRRGDVYSEIRLILDIIGKDKYFISANTRILYIACMCPDNVFETLGGMWAAAIAPGMGIDVAEEFVVDAFADDPDRYDLFTNLSFFEMRRRRFRRAEEIFGLCLDPVGGAGWNRQEVESKYEHAAEDYQGNAVHVRTAEEFLRAAEPYLAGKAGLVIVDAACGAGAIAGGLRPHAKTLIGVELSAGMAERARPLYDTMLVGDMNEAMLRLDGTADLVACCGALYYFEQASPFLGAAVKALAPGGLLIFSDYAAPDGRGVM